MKPIPPVDICKYFWTGEGEPTVTTGIPIGAVYIDKNLGDHYTRRPSGWVTGVTLTDEIVSELLTVTFVNGKLTAIT